MLGLIQNNASTNPNELYNLAEMTDEIISNILHLPYDQQMIAKLRFLDELSIKEISENLNLPQGTVKSRLFNIRKQLREKLEKDME